MQSSTNSEFDPIKDLNTFYGIGSNAKYLVLTEINAINNSILNLLTTTPGERLFEPEFGSWIQQYLFEPIDTTTASDIKEWVIRAMERWLPFLEVDISNSSVTPDIDNLAYKVRVVYSIVGTNEAKEFQVTVAR